MKPFHYPLVLFAFFLAACQPTPVPSTPTSEPGQMPLLVPVETTETAPPPGARSLPADAIVITPDILLDPALAQDENSFKVTTALYDGLVRLDSEGNIQPALAVSWRMSDDQLEYVLTLRDGLLFSDETPITPDVVIANFSRWFDPENLLHQGDFASWRRVFLGFLGEKETNGLPRSFFDGIEKVEKNVLIIHLNRPWPQLLQNLADPAFAILNPQVLADGNYGKVGSSIVSSGPYIVSEWTSQNLTLVPNPHYWGTPAQGDLNFTWPQ